MSDQQIAEIEVTMKQAEDLIGLCSSLERLQKNRDFKKVISEGYFKDEAVRLVGLKADPNVQSEEHQTAINKDIDAIGGLQQYLRTIYQRAVWAQQALQQGQEELDEINMEAEA